MSILVWDALVDRTYETGVDRGVLYLSSGLAVPWNGLISVTEKPVRKTTSVYFDGQKINELVSVGAFEGSMKALTYPEEFLLVEGYNTLNTGVYAGEQPPQSFALSFRTKIGNGLTSEAGYKIHILYNLVATPSDKSFESLSDDTNVSEFEWDLFAIPEEVTGKAPTAHLIIDSREVSASVLSAIESWLYGDANMNASLPTMANLTSFLANPMAITIRDNGDGTWTAIVMDDSALTIVGTSFSLTSANAAVVDANTYTITDTP